jgi:hypothetical protein
MTWGPDPISEPERTPDPEPTQQLPHEYPDEPAFTGPVPDDEQPRRSRRIFGAVLAFVLVASVATAMWIALGHSGGNAADNDVATAGGAKSPTATGSPLSRQDQAELARKFNQCMKDQGVDTQMSVAGGDEGAGPVTVQQSDGPGQAPPVDPKKVDAAMQKCKQFMPNGGEPPRMSPEELESMRKYAKCMRENGVPDFPDPNADGSMLVETTAGPNDSGTFSTGGMDPNSESFKRANGKCKQFAPSPPAGAQQGGN